MGKRDCDKKRRTEWLFLIRHLGREELLLKGIDCGETRLQELGKPEADVELVRLKQVRPEPFGLGSRQLRQKPLTRLRRKKDNEHQIAGEKKSKVGTGRWLE